MVKNLPAKAGGVGLIPSRGTKILHELEKPSCHDKDPVQPDQSIKIILKIYQSSI